MQLGYGVSGCSEFSYLLTNMWMAFSSYNSEIIIN